MELELRPCPFCGAKAYAVHRAWVFAEHWEIQTECGDGCINCGIEPEFGTEEEAEKAWNRRARPEEQDTWVRIDRDLTAHAVAYLLERGLMSEDEVREFDAAEREEAVRRDLVRRAKELAGKEAADE